MAVTVAWRITIRSESQTIPFTVFSQSGVGMVRSVAAKKSAAKKTPLPACARELHSIFHHVSYHAWRYKGVTNIRYYKKFFVFSPIFNTFEPRAAEMTLLWTFRWLAARRLRHLARRAFRFFKNLRTAESSKRLLFSATSTKNKRGLNKTFSPQN